MARECGQGRWGQGYTIMINPASPMHPVRMAMAPPAAPALPALLGQLLFSGKGCTAPRPSTTP